MAWYSCGVKTVRALVLAFLATTVVVTALSASASATVLCEEEPGEGACEVAYAKETVFAGKAAGSVFKSSLVNITCAASLEGHLSEEPTGEEKALNAQLSSLSFTECNNSCTVSTQNLPYSAPLSWTEGANGQMKISSGGKGSPGATISCPLFKCLYTTEPSLKVIGGKTAKVLATEVVLKFAKNEGGFGCPKEAFWNAEFSLNKPKEGKAFVAAVLRPATVFCTALMQGCGAGLLHNLPEQYFAEQNLFATVFDFEFDEEEYVNVCTEAALTVKTETFAAPLVANTIEGTPAVNNETCNLCTVVAHQLPYRLEIEAGRIPNVDGNGRMKLRSGGNGPPLFELFCTTLDLTETFRCYYEADGPAEQVEGTLFRSQGMQPADFHFEDDLELEAALSSGGCGEEMTWIADFEVTAPGTALNVTRG